LNCIWQPKDELGIVATTALSSGIFCTETCSPNSERQVGRLFAANAGAAPVIRSISNDRKWFVVDVLIARPKRAPVPLPRSVLVVIGAHGTGLPIRAVEVWRVVPRYPPPPFYPRTDKMSVAHQRADRI